MSDFRRAIRDEARQLQKLHKDLHGPTFARREWTDNVFARRSLGNDAEVELWYLAQHFLLAWHDWHGLWERHSRCFGESENSVLPEKWRRFDADCSILAQRLLGDRRLEGLILENWNMTSGVEWRTAKVMADSQLQDKVTVREVYHTLVESHRRWSLMQDAEQGRIGQIAATIDYPSANGDFWPRCRKMISKWESGLFTACRSLGPILGRELRFHLRHYRRANLLLSWLIGEPEFVAELPASDGRGDGFGYGDGRGDGRGDGWEVAERLVIGQSALLRFSSEKIVIPNVDHFLSALEDADVRGATRHVLDRIAHAIGEIGYDDFVEDLCSDDFQAGPDSLVGAGSINLIPSHARGPCQALLLAVSKGDKKAIGFQKIMQQVREHLIRCPVTQSVIVLCDHWRPGMLDENLGDFKAHHDRGVRFLFLMAGLPGRLVAPVAVDLGLS